MATLSIGQTTRESFWDIARSRALAAQIWKQAQRIRNSLVLVAELLLSALAYILAVWALAGTTDPSWARNVLLSTLALVILVRAVASFCLGLYRRSLRYASVADLISIAKIAAGSSLLLCGLAWFLFPQLKLSAAVFVVDWAFLQMFWGGLHFGARFLKTQRAVSRTGEKRVVIVGAGDAGMSLLKELALDPLSGCCPVAVLDDDPQKWGRTIYGVRVFPGGVANLAAAAAKTRAEEILICIPSASPSQMRQILGACRRASMPVRTLPSMAELVDGAVLPRDLRSPCIEDLLQREEIRVDVQATQKIVAGKVVLVTGAGGSIGSELCRQIAAAGPRKLLLLDKSENSLFYVHLEAGERLGSDRVKPLLVDLTNRDLVKETLQRERPQIVFHAAAHKHVGLLELHPQEAIRNNVMGTRNLAEAAMEAGAQTFVNISTDKAVNPRNYMGLFKKLTELCVQEFARNRRTRLMNVRFGNVAGSTGSVLRLFWDQIQKGGPIRVTDPRATRFFMSTREAVNLILRAAALGRGGETFVFDMGEPVNIYDLAKTMILFAGRKPGRDLPIEFSGLAEGEKITEELWEDGECPVQTEADRIFAIRDQNPLSRGILRHVGAMEEFLARGDRDGLLEYLHKVMPGFKHRQKRQFPVPVPDSPSRISLGAA